MLKYMQVIFMDKRTVIVTGGLEFRIKSSEHRV